MSFYTKALSLLLCCILICSSFLSGFAEEENTQPSYDISVNYSNAKKDGTIIADISVDVLAGSGNGRVGMAENLSLRLEGENGLKPDKGTITITGTSGTHTSRVRLRYSDPVPEQRIPEEAPKLKIYLESDNGGELDYYECKFDVQPTTRFLGIYRYDKDDAYKLWSYQKTAAEVIQRGIHLGTYYDEFADCLIKSITDDKDIFGYDYLGSLQYSSIDDNDLTYIYLGTHGLIIDNQPSPYLEFFDENGAYISAQQLLSYIEDNVRGRVVLILDSCFSGYITQTALMNATNADRFCIISATSSEYEAGTSEFSSFTMLSEMLSGDYALNDIPSKTTELGHMMRQLASKDMEYSTVFDFIPVSVNITAYVEFIYDKFTSFWGDLAALIGVPFEAAWDAFRKLTQSEEYKREHQFDLENNSAWNALTGPDSATLPTIYGNKSLPLFINNGGNYDDGFRLLVPEEQVLKFKGRVFTQANGRNDPIGGAYVQVYRKENGQFKKHGNLLFTGEDGVYEFTGKYGEYRFVASLGRFTDEKEMTIDADHAYAPNLLVGITLAGTVTDEESGKPLNAVIVSVTHEDGTQNAVVSDETGLWMANVQNGESVQCNFTGAGYESKDVSFDSYYTDGGSYYLADVALKPIARMLKGRVTDKDTGEPLTGASVKLRSGKGKLIAETHSSTKGEWEIEITAEQYSAISYASVTMSGYCTHKHYVKPETLKQRAFSGFDSQLSKLGVYDFLLVMDTSSSMEGTPISILKQTANQLGRSVFDNNDQSYMALMEYNSSTKLLNGFAPSTNINTFINQINGLDANGLTEIGNALSKTRDMVTQRKSTLDSQRLFDRRICVIFMSDGQPTDSIDRVYNMADRLHALNYVDVYTVGFFHDVNPSIRKNCEDILRYIASDSGKFYNVSSSTDFYWIFSDILDSLTQSQRTIITVDCPVDVSVTFDGETLDSSNTRTSFDTLQFEGAGNERKVLRLEAENDYRVTMKGTGDGYMDYTIQYVDANGEYSDTRKIVGIPVQYGMEAYSETQQGSSTSVYSSLNGNSPQIEYSARAGEKKVYNDHTSPVSSYSAGFAATASSYYEKNKPSVAPSMMIDGSLSTSWDAWGEYEGAWLAISTIDGYEYKINGFTINNGKNLRNGDDEYFKRNSRIKDCTVYVDGVLVGRYTLQDTSSAQTVSFNTPINGKQLKIVVDTVYEGTKYKDPNYGVCVTEIKLF